MVDSEFKLPEEFSQRMMEQLSNTFTDFEQSLKAVSPVSVRLNPLKKSFIEGEAVPWCKAGRYLEKRPVFTLDPAFHAGAYYVQEASSMFIEQVLLQLNLTEKPIRILDLCAAPGGKSTHITSLVHPDSLVVANEVIRSRATILGENVTKWGYNNCLVTNNDPEDFQQLPGFFDVIIIDAPCSGEGLFRKDRHAVNEWTTQNAQHCSKRQRRIVSDIWPSLKTNGILVYCTCTYNPAENEENIQWINVQHQVEPADLKLSYSWGIEVVNLGRLKGYRFYPHRVKGEGFFISIIRKNEIGEETRIKPKKSVGHPQQKLLDQLGPWVNRSEEISFQFRGETIYMIKGELLETISFLQQHLRVILAGTDVATAKGNKLVPDHALAVSVHLNKEAFPSLELSLDEAIQFLRRENPLLSSYKKGYTLVRFNSLPLGWLNILENRSNNLYPKEWRIRMKG